MMETIMTETRGRRFSNFADFNNHYAAVTASPDYAQAFGEELATAQLSAFDEPTEQSLPDPAFAEFCIQNMTQGAFDMLADTRLEGYAARIAWGIVNSLHMVANQIEREEDTAAQKLGDMVRSFDPSEIYANEVEQLQMLCQSLCEARAAVEVMRDHAGEVYRTQTGRPWSSTKGSKVSTKYSASMIEARDFLHSRAKARREQMTPTGPIVVISGGSEWADHVSIWNRLDQAKARVPSMTLATTAQVKGVDAIAAAWAASREVPLVAFRLNRAHGNAAPFKRNKLLVSLSPVEAIICKGSGIQINLADTCREAGIPVTIIRESQTEATQDAATRDDFATRAA
jgi:hypothetical protein